VFVSLLAACGRLGFGDNDPVDGPAGTPFSPTSNGCLNANAGPLTAVATLPTSTGGYGVWSAPPYLLEADTSGGLHALRFDGSTFTQTGTLPDLGWVEAVVSDGTHFYVGAPGTGFYVVDLLGDGSLQLAAQDLTITEARHAWFGNGNIYVPAGGNGLYALHYDGTTLAHVGTPTISMSWSQGAWANGSRVYLADADAFRILDFDGTAFTDAIAPKTDHLGTTRIWSNGATVFVAAADGLIAEHLDGSEVAFFPTANPARDVWFDGQHVFVAAEEDGLYALAFDGTSFTMIDHAATTGATLGVFGDGTYVYANDLTNGLTAYRGFACTAW
jgi:hypothetical protein